MERLLGDALGQRWLCRWLPAVLPSGWPPAFDPAVLSGGAPASEWAWQRFTRGGPNPAAGIFVSRGESTRKRHQASGDGGGGNRAMGPRAGTPRTDCIPKAGRGGVPPCTPPSSQREPNPPGTLISDTGPRNSGRMTVCGFKPPSEWGSVAAAPAIESLRETEAGGG